MDTPQLFTDAYKPAEIAQRVEQLGVSKAKADTLTVLVLALLAGAFISMAALFFLVVTTGSTAGFGPTRVLGGLAFSLGLILVVIAGAELFTGNNLLAMAWASNLISTRDVLRNWLLVYVGNVLGSVGTAALVLWAGTDALANGTVGETMLAVAQAKSTLSFGEVLARGILCNTLVCLAVWLAMGGHSVTDKILAIIFPITGFVAMGFEHSIANWFFLPLGFMLDSGHTLPVAGAAQNLLAATLGNILGGTVLVAGVYWLAYLRNSKKGS